MESLPVEVIEKIVCLLPPRDLGRCSAVCRKWREIINQDWIWKQHCDSELEESLRTTPCIATPVFTSPEVENSTLSPICQWRLAFMRENHLWNCWRRSNHRRHHPENNQLIRKERSSAVHIKFLTDTLVVVWYPEVIEILDVSIKPAVCKATSDYANGQWLSDHDKCSVLATTMLLIERKCSIDVFSVDLANKSIILEDRIILTESRDGIPLESRLVKEHIYLYVDDQSLNLKIVDLKTSKILKEEPPPIASKARLFSSPTSEYVALAFCDDFGYFNVYILSIKKLAILPDEIFSNSIEVALHSQWMAYYDDSNMLSVYDFETSQVLLRHEEELDSCKIHVCNNNFIFLFKGTKLNNFYMPPLVKCYSPLHQTLTTMFQIDHPVLAYWFTLHKVLNNKLLALFREEVVGLWKISNQKGKKYRALNLLKLYSLDHEINVDCKIEINQSCTIMAIRGRDKLLVIYLW